MDRLWDRLGELPDHRTLKGRRYSLAAIVGISLAAMLSGANDLRAIFGWGRRLTPKGPAAFGVGHGRAPCHATYDRQGARPHRDPPHRGALAATGQARELKTHDPARPELARPGAGLPHRAHPRADDQLRAADHLC